MEDDRFVSIAEELGGPAAPRTVTPPSMEQLIEEALGVLRKCKSRKEFAQKFLATPLYIRSLLSKTALGDLAPAVETLLYHYADGKPVDKVEFKDTTDPLDDFTPAQLEERAMRLLELARELRQDGEPEASSAKPQQTNSVH